MHGASQLSRRIAGHMRAPAKKSRQRSPIQVNQKLLTQGGIFMHRYGPWRLMGERDGATNMAGPARLSDVHSGRNCSLRHCNRSTQSRWKAGQAKDAVASEFVGSETCATCHEGVVKGFASNPHIKMAQMHGKSGITCENCHGAGKAHADNADPTKIFNPAKASAKEVDANCLKCHQGQHANFERSGHGEANVSCVCIQLPQHRMSGRRIPSIAEGGRSRTCASSATQTRSRTSPCRSITRWKRDW